MVITHIGNNTAGEEYSLKCTLKGYNSTENVTFQWTLLSGSEVSTSTNATSSASQLIFDPLQSFHEGNVICRATVENIQIIETYLVTVNGENLDTEVFDSCEESDIHTTLLLDPIALVSISEIGNKDIGSSFSLDCSISGHESLLNVSLTYQWNKTGGTHLKSGSILGFSSLRLSDIGEYICSATVVSSYLSHPAVYNNSYTLRLQSEFEQ